MNGFLAVNKPIGIPSFKVVSRLRGVLKEKRIGFAGTLDPFASGLLLVGIGRAFTRQLDLFLNLPKTYKLTWVLGLQTDTLDCYGKLTDHVPYTGSLDAIEPALASFCGTYDQQPPAFSAKKVQGVAAYHLARKGVDPGLAPSTIHIERLEMGRISGGSFPIIELEMTCSKGTYVRSLVRDVSAALGSVGYVKELCRSGIGDFTLDRAVHFDDLSMESVEAYRFMEAPCPL